MLSKKTFPIFDLRFSIGLAVAGACALAILGASRLRSLPPSISTIQPSAVGRGSASFPLTVNGANFVSGAVVRLNGTARTTSFVSSAKLTATVLAADVSSSGTLAVTVKNPDTQISNAVNLTVVTPTVPHVYNISPWSMVAGSPGFTLTVNGVNFQGTSVVTWNGSNRTTHFVSANQVTATLAASDISTLGYFPVRVVTPGAAGGTSNAATFAVVPPPTNINLMDFGYSPNDVTVVQGQRVAFHHMQPNVPHTVTRDVTSIPGPDSPTLSFGQVYNFTVPLNVAHGTNIFFHCQFHGAPGNGSSFGPGMSGVLRVK